MNLIKIACVMLAVAFFLGIVTSGGKDENHAVSTEFEDETVNSNNSGISGTVQAEEKSEISKISEPAVSKPAPDPLILEKGESKLAGERKNIENKVRATVRLIEAQGEAIFPSFREKGSPWFQENFCIFVWTEDGAQVVCPSDQSREGKAMKGLVDADGKPIGEIFIETALSEKGEGWIEYNWQEKDNSGPLSRCAFVKKASYEGKTYIVGADLNLENYLICRDLEECKYSEESGNPQIADLLDPKTLGDLELNCSIAHSIVESGKNTAPHAVKNSEIHYILEGQGLLYIDGIPVEIRPDQLIYIPAGSIQATYNTGDTVLKFLIIDQPARSKENTTVFE